MPDYTLGIDTSCYTTSVALASAGRVVCSERQLLSVDAGQRGLRQSEAVFQHVKALPKLMEKLFNAAPKGRLVAVAVSEKPRDREDSYMPVFQTGKSFAQAIAYSHGVSLIATTHQQGHIRAALVDSGMPKGKFVALHLSGGTTQSLLVDENLNCSDIGGSNDLNAGQLVDRTGVLLGLGFPSGPQLEQLAINGVSRSLIPLSKSGSHCSFSGAENKIQKLIEDGTNPNDVAREVYSFLERSIAHLVASACEQSGINNVLLAGGVASSKLLRELLCERIKKRNGNIHLYWGKPELSGDNACGVALIGDDTMRGKKYGDDN